MFEEIIVRGKVRVHATASLVANKGSVAGEMGRFGTTKALPSPEASSVSVGYEVPHTRSKSRIPGTLSR